MNRQITTAIDAIAFQTNILALSAAIETARADEVPNPAHRTFASAVRTLDDTVEKTRRPVDENVHGATVADRHLTSTPPQSMPARNPAGLAALGKALREALPTEAPEKPVLLRKRKS